MTDRTSPDGFDVVIPTVGRASLARLLDRLGRDAAELTGRVIVVDDRRRRRAPLPPAPASLGPRLRVVATPGGVGPAAARNLGTAHAHAPWVAFLDDDVVPAPGWTADLRADLAGAAPRTAGVQGRLVVPVRARPADRERNVAGLEHAAYATADMAYRRHVLEAVGGFDEGFRTAYREDADLAARVRAAGYALGRGTRTCVHPVRTESRWASVARQRGNAADARLRRKHGRRWRARTRCGTGRLPAHVLTVVALTTAVVGASAHHRRLAAAAALAWCALTAEFAWRRIAPGPRTPDEVLTMVATSALIPPVAVAHRVAGELHERIAS